ACESTAGERTRGRHAACEGRPCDGYGTGCAKTSHACPYMQRPIVAPRDLLPLLTLLGQAVFVSSAPVPGSLGPPPDVTYKVKDNRKHLCSAEAPVNVGGACEDEVACGGVEGESGFCVPKGFPTGIRVSLRDAFETAIFDGTEPVSLGSPASREGAGIDEPPTHRRGYRSKLTTVARQPGYQKRG